MQKTLLKNDEIPAVIRKCYESDKDHMLKYLFDAEMGLDYSINRTANDFIKNNINIYTIYNNKDFIGYFGEEALNGDNYLSGFFIMPEKRKEFKSSFWKAIKAHFLGNFKVFMSDLNQPAKKFLLKNNCILINQFNSDDYGIMNLLEYKEHF